METVRCTFENRRGEVAKVDGEVYTVRSKSKAKELAFAFNASRLIGLDSKGNITEVIDLD